MGRETAKLDSAYSFALENDDYLGLDISLFEIEVDEGLVNHRFEELLRQVSYQDLASEAIRDDDIVIVDYEGTIGPDAVSASGLSVRVGFKEFLAPFEASLIGRHVGDTYVAVFQVPQVHLKKSWQGARAELSVTVRSARRPVSYEATDAYVASVSEFESVDELKQVIREQFEYEVEQESLRLLRVQASEKIGQLAKGRFSEDELLKYAEIHLPDETPANANQLPDTKKAEIVDSAAFEIGWRNIARREGIAVDEDDVERAYAELKAFYRGTARPNKDMRKEALDGLLCEMAVNRVLQAANISSLQNGNGGEE